MDIKKEREAFSNWFESNFSNGEVIFGSDGIPLGHEKALSWKAWQAAKAESHKSASLYQWEINHLAATNQQWSDYAAKSSAVPEGRTDFEIIEQTIAIVDLLADANRFKRDKSKPFPFESENPRNIEWWRVACQIQELLTDTDPNNCDFEEYKAMIEAAQGEGHE